MASHSLGLMNVLEEIYLNLEGVVYFWFVLVINLLLRKIFFRRSFVVESSSPYFVSNEAKL